jgi:hypothetical protein
MTSNQVNSTGGALCLREGSSLTLSGRTRLRGNSAGMLGGGVALLGTPLWQLQRASDELIIEGNTANRGSAAFFAAVVEGGAYSNITFRKNKAVVGGTVFWLRTALMPQEPAGVGSADAVWEGNEAGYGPTMATQAVDLWGPGAYDVQVYGLVLSPPMNLSMTDHYGQFVPTDSFSTVLNLIHFISFSSSLLLIMYHYQCHMVSLTRAVYI